MTAQQLDEIIISGVPRALLAKPLDGWLRAHRDASLSWRPERFPDAYSGHRRSSWSTSKAKVRGYVATWEIRDGILWLTQLLARESIEVSMMNWVEETLLLDRLGADPLPVAAGWVTGVLRVGMGEFRASFESWEEELAITVEEGRVVDVERGAGPVEGTVEVPVSESPPRPAQAVEPELVDSQLRVPRLEGWFAKASITVLAPDGQANVIASSEPLHHSVNTQDYAETQGQLLRTEFPHYREFHFQPASIFGGHPGYVRRFQWTPPDGVPVMQIQMYYASSGVGYTATATTSVGRFSAVEQDLLTILEGIVL